MSSVTLTLASLSFLSDLHFGESNFSFGFRGVIKMIRGCNKSLSRVRKVLERNPASLQVFKESINSAIEDIMNDSIKLW